MKEVALSLNDRGIVYRKRGVFNEAILDYNYAIQLIPNFAHAFYNRGTDKDIEDTKIYIKMIMKKKKLSTKNNISP
jgi:Flp pilus assembly protein TadD